MENKIFKTTEMKFLADIIICLKTNSVVKNKLGVINWDGFQHGNYRVDKSGDLLFLTNIKKYRRMQRLKKSFMEVI